MKVSDTGTGIPKEVLERVFEPFFTTKPKGEGTGLGLATVYGIVTQAGGALRIYSEPGMGTSLNVLLPVTDQPRDADVPLAEPAAGRGQTVLIVEDEAAMREVTRRLLDRNGYRVLAAPDGQAALDIVASHPGPIDVLLTDVVMPKMQGGQVAEQVRARVPGVRVLFMSGYTQGLLGSQGVLEPGVHLLEKPFTEPVLLRKLAEVLSAPGSDP
jgi:two-component system, cell cycle sensor histidine kinase and response regulator CckA